MSNVDLVQGLYGAFAEGDVPTVVGGMDADIHWREAEGNPYQPSGAAWVGADAIVENLFMKLATEWDGFSVHPDQYHDAGDTVVVEGRYTGKVPGDRGRPRFPVLPRLQVQGRQGDELPAVHRYGTAASGDGSLVRAVCRFS